MVRPKIYNNDIDRKEAIKKSKSKYMLTKQWYCHICDNGLNYKLAGKWCHLNTKLHKRNHENYILNLNINIII